MSDAGCFDVVVVGAGLSGLSCAEQLAAQELRVCVVEANGRPGGRTCTVETGHGYVDVGGQWIGATHSRLRKLASSLNIQTFEQHCKGRRIFLTVAGQGNGRGGGGAAKRTATRSEYAGTIPPTNILVLLEVQTFIWRMDAMARRVPLEDPGMAQEAAAWDALSMAAWLNQHTFFQGTRQTVELACAMVLGVQCSQVSLLYFLFYVHAAGGLEQLLEVKGAAQEGRFVGGSQQLSEGLVRRIVATGLGTVSFGCPVVRVERQLDGAYPVRVTARKLAIGGGGGGDVVGGGVEMELLAKAVVWAAPPSAMRDVDVEPSLPGVRQLLNGRATMGTYTKVIVHYREPFWRERGLSGEAVCVGSCEEYPLLAVYDGCHADSSHPSLVCFLAGDIAMKMGQLNQQDRHAAVTRSLVAMFGEQACAHHAIDEKEWHKDPFARGCPVGTFPCGAFAPMAKCLRAPIGRLFFAATETATCWPGYMEGALEAAERCAAQVAQALAVRGAAGRAVDESCGWTGEFERLASHGRRRGLWGWWRVAVHLAVLGAAAAWAVQQRR